MSNTVVEVTTKASGQIVIRDEAGRDVASEYFNACRPYHEAAHAVVALALGGKCRTITLDPVEAENLLGLAGAPWGGACDIEPSRPNDWREVALYRIAGPVQDAFFGAPGRTSSGPAAFAAACAHAPYDVGLLIDQYPDESERNAAIERVKGILRERQAEVLNVGAALKERGRLVGSTVVAIIELVRRLNVA